LWQQNGMDIYNTNSGKVGIGTESPTEKLHIKNGSIYVEGEGQGVIVNEGGHKRVGLMKYSGHEAGIWRTSGQDFEIGRVNVNYLPGNPLPTVFNTDIYISGIGNVGIGTTNPGAQLDVKLPLNAPLATMAASFSTNNENGKVFIVPELCGWGFNAMSVGGDQGIFWSDSQAGAGNNQNAGFVIGPQKDGYAYGIRITNIGDSALELLTQQGINWR